MGATIYEKLLMAKIEATKGTDSVPAPGTDAVRAISVEKAVTVDEIERVVVKGTMGKLPHCIGKSMMVLTITCEMKGGSAAGVAPEVGPLYRACGLDETIVGGSSVAYDPLTITSAVPHEAVSIYWYEDGLLWKFIGAEGSMEITYEMNQKTQIVFTMSAPYLAPTTVADPGGEAYDATIPVVASNADVVSEGSAIKVGSFGLSDGNDVQEHYTTGQHEFTVSDRNPTMTLSKDSVSTIADWTALAAGTNVALSAVIDGGAGNKLTISAPVAKRKGISDGVRAERALRELEYGLYESSGDDAFQILIE
jgi:hypothetical protein